MLNREQMYCGVYDSLVAHKHENRSPMRCVTQYELELYHTDIGVSYIDGEIYPIRRECLFAPDRGSSAIVSYPYEAAILG